MVPRKRGDNSRRVLPWALLFSIFYHAVLIPVLLWIIAAPYLIPKVKPPEQLLMTTTVTTISQHNATVPNHHVTPQPKVQQPQPTVAQTPAPPPPHVLAQLVPHAQRQSPVQSRNVSMGDQIAAQEKAFANEAQQLHAQSNPLDVPSSPPYKATTYKHSYFDDPGYQKSIQGGMAVLESTQQWYVGNLSCHYAHYDMSFRAGGDETGIIPWPVCYARTHDLLSMHVNYKMELPVPLPQPGYVLPSGTYLTPFLQQIYDQRPQ